MERRRRPEETLFMNRLLDWFDRVRLVLRFTAAVAAGKASRCESRTGVS
ncbi:MAG: hypothetical protein ACJAXA_003215, partial [Candidatus Aldehydirespiratoraceae bacterium]